MISHACQNNVQCADLTPAGEKQAERERHLVEMDQLKTGFFTNISHELRTPLTVIQGPLEMMLQREKNETNKNTLSIMLRNTRRIGDLITQLLDHRKIELGLTNIEVTEDDISRCIEGIVNSLQPLAESRNVQCRLVFNEPCRGWFDPDKLEKVLSNLVSNAIKYTPANGEVVIKAEVLSGTVGERRLRLTIEDSGLGIDAEHLSRIFDRFYRVPEEKITDGLGIGLNLTRELVERWGGEITAESPIHEDPERPGSRFTVTLPIDRENMTSDIEVRKPDDVRHEEATAHHIVLDEGTASHSLSTHSEASATAPSILIVEDDADVRAFIASGLTDYRLHDAVNGAEGVKKAREIVPDLIVTDLMMPLMNGLELCSELKTNRETSHIPIILLTAKASLPHQLEGFKAGADDYLSKPFHMEMLQTRIRNLLESRRLLREQFSSEFMLFNQPLPKQSLDQEFLEQLLQLMDEHCCDPAFTPERLAEMVHMSTRTLQRKVKALTDRTPVNLLIELRLKKAAELLTASSMNVTEIAFDVGFGNLGNFQKKFKKRYEMSPSEFRRQS